MDTDIFSTFDTSGETGGSQEFSVDGVDPLQTPQAQEGDGEQQQQDGDQQQQQDGGAGGGDTVTIKKEDWDRTQQMLAEFKGFMTAKQAAQEPAQPQRPQYDPQQAEVVRQQQTAQQQQFNQILDSVTEDLTSLDPARTKQAVQRLIGIGAQLGAMQAQQMVSPATSTTADLMIENYITRKSTKDNMYDLVGERFEKRLGEIDPRVIAGYSRAQLNQVLDEMYDAEVGRWARDARSKSQQRQQQQVPGRQIPPNYGGGKAAPGITTQRSAGTVPDEWKKFARDAGIPEDQITPELFRQAIGE